MRSLTILHLEDDPLDAELILASLEEGGILPHATRVETRAEFLAALDSGTFDMVLADYSLPMFDGLAALKLARDRGFDFPFILLSGALGEDVAIESLKSGATDYVLKQNLDRLAPAVHRALRETEERAQRRQAEEALRERATEIADLNVRLQRAMAESHHRIKNNLQVLAALIEMQILNHGETVPVSELERLTQHIRNLAALHDLLTTEAKVTTKSLDTVSLKAALQQLTPMLESASGGRQVTVRAAEVRIPLKQASSFVLLVNELIANAVKHGSGAIEVSLQLLESQAGNSPPSICLEVCDDGPGFPPDFNPQKAANTGLELIETMGRWDLHGEIAYTNRPEGGARVTITFPLSVPIEASAYAVSSSHVETMQALLQPDPS